MQSLPCASIRTSSGRNVASLGMFYTTNENYKRISKKIWFRCISNFHFFLAWHSHIIQIQICIIILVLTLAVQHFISKKRTEYHIFHLLRFVSVRHGWYVYVNVSLSLYGSVYLCVCQNNFGIHSVNLCQIVCLRHMDSSNNSKKRFIKR